jgi:hypothetical protein
MFIANRFMHTSNNTKQAELRTYKKNKKVLSLCCLLNNVDNNGINKTHAMFKILHLNVILRETSPSIETGTSSQKFSI